MKTTRIEEIRAFIETDFYRDVATRLANVVTKHGAEQYPEIVLFTSPFTVKVLRDRKILAIDAMGVRELTHKHEIIEFLAQAILALTTHRSPVGWKSSLREDYSVTKAKFTCAYAIDDSDILSRHWNKVFSETAERVVARSYKATQGDTPTLFLAPGASLLKRYEPTLTGFIELQRLIGAFARFESEDLSLNDFLAFRERLLSGEVYFNFPDMLDAYTDAVEVLGGTEK